ncbi:MAG: hypothetical protein JXR48_00170, partial [Candidatus Delongbacteria bacterium]|nr:hypothetical protein [Candidatus Delongbacteria bacterium]MBN2833358.1 hypothetical protein [Candidatus Delongbacteria bacterium]
PVQDTFGIVVVMGEEDKLSSSKAKMLKIKNHHQRNSNRKVSGAGSIWSTRQIEWCNNHNILLTDAGFGSAFLKS